MTNKAKSKQQSGFSYADAIKELEEITAYLESSSVDLDEAIKKFERGNSLASEVQKHLEQAENRIKTIKDNTST